MGWPRYAKIRRSLHRIDTPMSIAAGQQNRLSSFTDQLRHRLLDAVPNRSQMSPMTLPPLSIQDLAPISKGYSTTDALARTLDLARLGDEMSFVRLWYAEHHGMASIASSAPEILIANAAANTKTIRVGAGGVMLPNHVPLRVVETYRTLNGLYPDRIDLGIGRAGGSDGLTLRALRSTDGQDFPHEFAELLAFERGGFPDDHPFSRLKVVPDEVPLAPIWLLGSSGASAQM